MCSVNYHDVYRGTFKSEGGGGYFLDDQDCTGLLGCNFIDLYMFCVRSDFYAFGIKDLGAYSFLVCTSVAESWPYLLHYKR